MWRIRESNPCPTKFHIKIITCLIYCYNFKRFLCLSIVSSTFCFQVIDTQAAAILIVSLLAFIVSHHVIKVDVNFTCFSYKYFVIKTNIPLISIYPHKLYHHLVFLFHNEYNHY